ncbi:TPA: DNA cytosine methyltransferase [Pseudomonas aeruginosa]|nr:DNA cytosine methyltransferase [Pseudomonas aeruginosa]
MNETHPPYRRKKPLTGYVVKNIGMNRGRPRIWLQDYEVSKSGLKPGDRYEITMRGGSVILTANPDGSRVVSAKKLRRPGEPEVPVIDINSSQALALFEDMPAIRMVQFDGEIHLLPLATELRKKERLSRLRNKMAAGKELDVGSLSHGGGFMSHAVHEGLGNTGIGSNLRFANEIRNDLVEHTSRANDIWRDTTVPIVAPMQEFAFDEAAAAHLPRVDLLEIGMPCSGASVAGRAKRKTSMPEEHPDVGHLVVGALAIVARSNAAVVLIECVVPYASSASAAILRNHMRDFGYEVHEAILEGSEFNALENRKRWFTVAVTEGMHFDWDMLQRPEKREMRLGDVLDDIPIDSPLWSAMDGLKEKEVRDIAAGKHFMMQIFNAESTHIGTVGKGYQKNRSTEPKIQAEHDPKLLRLLTPAEHSRVKQHPESLIKGISSTLAHELLGQGIVRGQGVALGEAIGESICRFAAEHRPKTADEFYEAIKEELEHSVALSVVELRAALANVVYEGPVTVNELGAIVQDIGNGVGIIHKSSETFQGVSLGDVIRVSYPSKRALPRVENLTSKSSREISQELMAAAHEANAALQAAQQNLFGYEEPTAPAVTRRSVPRFSA